MVARLLCIILAAGTLAGSGGAATSRPGSIVFRCGDNICRVAPDGSERTQLTKNGRSPGPSYGWLSATRDGSRLGVAFGNEAYVLDGTGRRVKGPFRKNGAVLQVQIRPDGRQLATIEQVPETIAQVPPTPPVHVLTPFLYLTGISGTGRDAVARSTATSGWLGNRLMRDESSRGEPFEQGICLLVSNASHECARSLAVDAGHDLWGPVASPDGRFIAVARGARDSQPSWSPDGKRIVFTRARSLYVVPAAGGPTRRVAAGIQPIWVTGRR